MADSIKLIECPRDAWQGLPGQIPTSVKVEYLKALIAAGFKHIDAVSFVSPKAIPQMADSEEVLKELDPPDDVEIIGLRKDNVKTVITGLEMFNKTLEFAIAGNWTAKAEYLYVNLGKLNCGISCGAFVTDNVSFTTNLVRAGVNYRF